MELMPYSESIWLQSSVVACPEVKVSRLEISLMRKGRTKLNLFSFFSGSTSSCRICMVALPFHEGEGLSFAHCFSYLDFFSLPTDPSCITSPTVAFWMLTLFTSLSRTVPGSQYHKETYMLLLYNFSIPTFKFKARQYYFYPNWYI